MTTATRIDCRPYAAVLLVTAVFGYLGCTGRAPAPPVAPPAPAPAAGGAPPAAGGAAAGSPSLVPDWTDPAAVLVVSGEDDGYMEPCGCSADQIGGLIRRYDFVERLHERKWPTALIHLGGLLKNPGGARGGFEQAKIKFDTAVKALALLNYAALALCPEDLKVGVGEATSLLENSLGESTKIVAANVQPDAYYEKIVRPSVIVAAGPVKLGITAVTDPALLAKLVDPEKDRILAKIQNPDDALPGVLKSLEAVTDYQILMVQGPTEMAKRLAEANPGFDVVVATSESADPLSHEPEPLNGGKTALVSIGRKGKYVGAIGLFPSGSPRLKFELVILDKRYSGPATPMKTLIQDDYRNNLKLLKTAETYPKHKYVGGAPGAEFVGALACRECHPKTYEFWKTTGHAGAFTSLLHDPKPNSAFDAECVSCHTTGFDYLSGFRSEALTPLLAGNQCENCHGPGSKHCADPDNDKFQELMTVTIEQADKNRLCTACHDEDNSREFEFKKYWKEIRHNRLDSYDDPKVHRGINPKVLPPEPAAKVP